VRDTRLLHLRLIGQMFVRISTMPRAHSLVAFEESIRLGSRMIALETIQITEAQLPVVLELTAVLLLVL
jgi:hypothetical protein